MHLTCSWPQTDLPEASTVPPTQPIVRPSSASRQGLGAALDSSSPSPRPTSSPPGKCRLCLPDPFEPDHLHHPTAATWPEPGTQPAALRVPRPPPPARWLPATPASLTWALALTALSSPNICGPHSLIFKLSAQVSYSQECRLGLRPASRAGLGCPSPRSTVLLSPWYSSLSDLLNKLSCY